MNRERAKRREEIAVRLVASMCVDPDASWESTIRAAMTGAEMLMAKLDEAALADTPDTAVELVNKSILICQKDRQIADLERKLATLTEFAEAVRSEAEDDDELYGPFVALVRDLDAKVGAK